jgi:hypothetical protein
MVFIENRGPFFAWVNFNRFDTWLYKMTKSFFFESFLNQLLSLHQSSLCFPSHSVLFPSFFVLYLRFETLNSLFLKFETWLFYVYHVNLYTIHYIIYI